MTLPSIVSRRVYVRPIATAIAAGVFAAARLAAQSAGSVREKVAVEVITIHLTARDHSGGRVVDLLPAELSLTVDGRPVAIETFAPPDGLEAAVSSENSEGAAALRERTVRTLIFVDEAATLIFDRKDVLDELDRFIRGPASENREFLVARFDGTRLRMESAWTSDAAVTAAAVGRIREKPSLNRVPTASGVSGFGSAELIQATRDRMNAALLEAIAAFPVEPAERRLLVVSSGTTLLRPTDLAMVLACQLTPGDRARLWSRPRSEVATMHAREVERATFSLWARAVNPGGDALSMSDVTAKALERDVAIIPVSAEAVGRGGMPAAGDGQISIGIGVGQSMMEIAESTGAEPILLPRKTAARLNEIGGRAVYAMTFQDPMGDHRYHRVAVTCRRPGVRIEYRRGYRIPGDDERTLDAVVAQFLQPRQRSDPMATVIHPSRVPGDRGHAATKLDIRYSPPLETGAGDERAIQIVAVGEDAEGSRTEPIAWSGTAYRASTGDDFEAEMTLGIPPGAYGWSIAVRDQPTGLTSYAFVSADAH
jgi:VWFA-related protein